MTVEDAADGGISFFKPKKHFHTITEERGLSDVSKFKELQTKKIRK
jgi:hypothetical protein